MNRPYTWAKFYAKPDEVGLMLISKRIIQMYCLILDLLKPIAHIICGKGKVCALNYLLLVFLIRNWNTCLSAGIHNDPVKASLFITASDGKFLICQNAH
jgi:hypothetical protein